MPAPSFVVLTAAPGSGVLTKEIVGAARQALSFMDGVWLAPGEAYEARVEATGRSAAEIRCLVTSAVGSAPVDVNVVSGDRDQRRKRLLCADMESTIICEELIDEMADMVGCRPEIAAITEAAMRGDVDFEAALIRRVALFKGLPAQRLEEMLQRVTLMPGAETLIRTLSANGTHCALVSGGFTVFADVIARQLGFHTVVANALRIDDGKLTGEVREPIVGPDSKAQALKRIAAELDLDLSETLAVGDGANDLVMLRAAGLGVAFRAKPILVQSAASSPNGAVVAHGDLTALLYLQGYARETFVV